MMRLPRFRFTIRRMMITVLLLGVCFGWIAFLLHLPSPEDGSVMHNDLLTLAMVLIGTGTAALVWREIIRGPRR